MQVDRGPLGVLRHLVAVVEVVAQLLRLVLVQEVGIRAVGLYRHGQQAVHDDVRVATYRRREVGVYGRGQPIVVELAVLEGPRAEVHRLHHAARGHDAEHGVQVGLVQDHRLVQGPGERL